MDYSVLEKRIGHVFLNKSLLIEALTHSSYSNELSQKGKLLPCNERLEFLGDTVLDVISSTFLFSEYPDMAEGELSRIRSEAICTDALSSYALKIGLGDFLLLGIGESKNGGKTKPTTLENAFEALLGAMYLDCGKDLRAVSGFLIPFISDRIVKLENGTEVSDAKSELQQIIQQTPGEELKYIVTNKTGPDNDPVFTVEAHLNSNVIGIGVGPSKKKAEQEAAKDALKKFFKKYK